MHRGDGWDAAPPSAVRRLRLFLAALLVLSVALTLALRALV